MIIKALTWWFKVGETLKTEVRGVAESLGQTDWVTLTNNRNKLNSTAKQIFDNLYPQDTGGIGYLATAKRKAIKSTLKDLAEKKTASKIIKMVMNKFKPKEFHRNEYEVITTHQDALKSSITSAFHKGEINIISVVEELDRRTTINFDPSKKTSKKIIKLFQEKISENYGIQVEELKNALKSNFTEQELKILSFPRIPAKEINAKIAHLKITHLQLLEDAAKLCKADKKRFREKQADLREKITALEQYAGLEETTFNKYHKFSTKELEEKIEALNTIIREFPFIIEKFSEDEQRLLHLSKNSLPVEERMGKIQGR